MSDKTSRIHVCNVYTSFERSQHLFRLEHYTSDIVLYLLQSILLWPARILQLGPLFGREMQMILLSNPHCYLFFWHLMLMWREHFHFVRMSNQDASWPSTGSKTLYHMSDIGQEQPQPSFDLYSYFLMCIYDILYCSRLADTKPYWHPEQLL